VARSGFRSHHGCGAAEDSLLIFTPLPWLPAIRKSQNINPIILYHNLFHFFNTKNNFKNFLNPKTLLTGKRRLLAGHKGRDTIPSLILPCEIEKLIPQGPRNILSAK